MLLTFFCVSSHRPAWLWLGGIQSRVYLSCHAILNAQSKRQGATGPALAPWCTRAPSASPAAVRARKTRGRKRKFCIPQKKMHFMRTHIIHLGERPSTRWFPSPYTFLFTTLWSSKPPRPPSPKMGGANVLALSCNSNDFPLPLYRIWYVTRHWASHCGHNTTSTFGRGSGA